MTLRPICADQRRYIHHIALASAFSGFSKAYALSWLLRTHVSCMSWTSWTWRWRMKTFDEEMRAKLCYVQQFFPGTCVNLGIFRQGNYLNVEDVLK